MDQWTLLWSCSQNALHIEPLERLLSLNRESYRDNEPVYYAPIAIGSLAEMQAAAENIRPTLIQRERAPAQPEAA